MLAPIARQRVAPGVVVPKQIPSGEMQWTDHRPIHVVSPNNWGEHARSSWPVDQRRASTLRLVRDQAPSAATRPIEDGAVARNRLIRRGGSPADLHATASSVAPATREVLRAATEFRQVFSRGWASTRGHTASQWLGSGRRPAAPRSPGPQWRRVDFLPLGAPPRGQARGTPEAHSSRGKKVAPPPSSAALRRASACVVDRLRPADRHRGRGGRGLEFNQGEVTWPTSVLSRSPARSSRARS